MAMAVKETLSGSDHYIWYLRDIIGKGATGNVFKCRNKHSGDVFAVKTFDSVACSRVPGLQAREIEVIRQLRHSNIVEVVAVEAEVQTGSHVIIMELCVGSVYHMLEEPDNSYGVTEELFVQILKDVANGMRYLDDMRVVHRDIKPGNILKVVKEDGDIVFKLSDFGASRQMREDEENFYSLHGTEEYLEPTVFRHAVLRQGLTQGFDASIDLWSLGVTLYQIIAGQLPFRPLNGRNGSKKTMFRLTAEKDSGAISGEEVEKGRIVWSRELPDTCQLSHGFKCLITPVLAGLLENDPQQKWDFDTFYKNAESVWTKIRFHVFHMFECSSISVYADKDFSLATLNELIAQQTGVPAVTQLLLFNNKPLTAYVSGICPADKFPKTTNERPYILFYHTDFGDVVKLKPLVIPPFPVFGTTFSLENDASLSKKCAATLWLIFRNVHYYMRQQILLEEAVAMVSLFISDLVEDMTRIMDNVQCQIEHLEKEFSRFDQRKKETIRMFELMGSDRSPHVNNLIQQVKMKLKKHSDDILAVTKTMQKQKKHVDDFNKRVIEHKELEGMWRGDLGCTNPEKCMKMIGSLVNMTCETSRAFREHKIIGKLSYNEEQIHKVDKNKLNTTCSKAVSLCNEACFASISKLHKELTQTHLGSQLHGWFRFAVQVKVRTERLTSKIQSLSSTGHQMSTDLDAAHDILTQSMTDWVRGQQVTPDSGFMTGGEAEPAKSMEPRVPTTVDDPPMTDLDESQQSVWRRLQKVQISQSLLEKDVKEMDNAIRDAAGSRSLPVSRAGNHGDRQSSACGQALKSTVQRGIATKKLNHEVN